MKDIKKRKDSNVCGIIGICICWIFPLAGLILGIIALSRREKTKALGVLAILISLVMGFVSMLIAASLVATIPTGY